MWTRLVEWSARVRAFVAGEALDRDFDDELESHLAMLTEDNVRSGMSHQEAKRAALLRLGNRESTAQRHRELARLPTLEAVLQDVRYAMRALGRDLGFATFAVLIIALGIGASVTVFSVVNAILIHPLPFPQADRSHGSEQRLDGVSGRTVPTFHFAESAGSQSIVLRRRRIHGVLRRRRQQADRRGRAATAERRAGVAELFLRPWCDGALGRTFTAEECRFNGPKAVMLAYAFWRDKLDSDPTIVGRSLTLNDAPVTVIGVLPSTFDFAIGVRAGHPHRAVLPVSALRGNQSLGQHDGDGRAPEGRRHAAAGAGRARRPGAADSPSRSRTELRAAPSLLESTSADGSGRVGGARLRRCASACSSCAQTSPT